MYSGTSGQIGTGDESDYFPSNSTAPNTPQERQWWFPALPHSRPTQQGNTNSDIPDSSNSTSTNSTLPTPILVNVPVPETATFPVLLFVGICVVIVLIVLKILSVLLAWRIARMLRAQAMVNLDHPVVQRHIPTPIVYTPQPPQQPPPQGGYVAYIAQQVPPQQYYYPYVPNPYTGIVTAPPAPNHMG